MKILIILFIFLLIFLFFFSNCFSMNFTESLLINPVLPMYQKIVIENSKNSNTINILASDSNSLYFYMKNTSSSAYSPYYINFSLNGEIPIFSIYTTSKTYQFMSTSPFVSAYNSTNSYPFTSVDETNTNTLTFTDSIIFQNKYIICFDSKNGNNCIIQSMSTNNDGQIVFPFLSGSNNLVIFTNFKNESSFSLQFPATVNDTISYAECNYSRLPIAIKNNPPYETRITFLNNMYIDGTDSNLLYFVGNSAIININMFQSLNSIMFGIINFKSYQIDQYGKVSYITFNGEMVKQQPFPDGSVFDAKPLLYALPASPSETADGSSLFNIDQIIIQSATNFNCISIQVVDPYLSLSSGTTILSTSNKALLFQSLMSTDSGDLIPNPDANKVIYFNLNVGGYFHIIDALTFTNANQGFFVGYGDSIESTPSNSPNSSGESSAPTLQLLQGYEDINPGFSTDKTYPVESINPNINRVTCIDGILFQNNNSIQITGDGNILLQIGTQQTIIDLTKNSSISPPLTFTNDVNIDQTIITNPINMIEFSNNMVIKSSPFGIFGTSASITFSEFLTAKNNFSGTMRENIAL